MNTTTIGSQVLFTPSENCAKRMPGMAWNRGTPMTATVAFINEDGTVNLAVLDHLGQPFDRNIVPLFGSEQETPSEFFAQWPKVFAQWPKVIVENAPVEKSAAKEEPAAKYEQPAKKYPKTVRSIF